MLSFTMLQPPLDVLRLLVYGEIGMTQLFSKILACAHSYLYFFIHVRTFAEISFCIEIFSVAESAKDFEYDDLFVHYFVELPSG